MNTTPLILQPLDYGILLLLEKIGHPLLTGGQIAMTQEELVRALLIFSAPDEAFNALLLGRDHFERAAFALARSLRVEDLAGLKEALQAVVAAAPAETSTAEAAPDAPSTTPAS